MFFLSSMIYSLQHIYDFVNNKRILGCYIYALFHLYKFVQIYTERNADMFFVVDDVLFIFVPICDC